MTMEALYRRAGGDYAAVLARLPDKGLVERFVRRYPEDPSFGNLSAAIPAGDWEAAFRAAHTLKGLALNLGFGDLYRAADALTEALRGPKALEEPALFAAVQQAHGTLLSAIGELD